MKYLIDSSAWIDFLEGDERGEEVWKIIKSKEVYALNLIISEVVSYVKRKNGDFNLAFRTITSNSKVLEVNLEIAKDAGILHADMKKETKNFGLIDAIIYTAAKKIKAKVVTGDPHFKKLKGVVFLK